MRLKPAVFILAFLWQHIGSVYSQSVNDTIIIDDIIIKGKATSDNPGFKQTIIDSVALDIYRDGSLSDVLINNSLVFVKSYGMGSLSTPSLRGTGASHTSVLWNGKSINSPMVGQSDLSLVPAGMIDDVRVFYGGASLVLNSGGIGGIINVESKPSWKNQRQLIINPGIGSFGKYTGLIKYSAGTDIFQSITRLSINSAENDFKYVNSFFSNQPVEERRKNAEVFQTGIMQEFYLKRSKSNTSAHFWYQSSDRNLPVSMLVKQVNPGEKQLDSFFRSIIQHKIYNPESTFDFSISWFNDHLNYINKEAAIDSKNTSSTYSAKSGVEIKTHNSTTLKASLTDDLIIVKSNNYDSNKKRNIISGVISAEHKYGNKFGTVFLLRQTIKDNEILVPDFSFGLDYKLLNNHDFHLKSNYSRNSRVPTMNDIYWNPGGNSTLKNEYSYLYELSMEIRGIIRKKVEFYSEATYFNNHIYEMIQWQPGEFLYWTPENIGNVKTSGLEATMELSYNNDAFTFKANTGYAMTMAKSINQSDIFGTSDKTQLIYVPVHQVNAGFKMFFREFYSSWILNFTGKRFIAVDNSQYLPGSTINDLIIGFKIFLNENNIDINARIENIFGVNYQTIAYYPMPGRSVFINILYKFNK